MELEYINKILHVNQYNICSIYERRSMEIQYKVVKDTNTFTRRWGEHGVERLGQTLKILTNSQEILVALAESKIYLYTYT